MSLLSLFLHSRRPMILLERLFKNQQKIQSNNVKIDVTIFGKNAKKYSATRIKLVLKKLEAKHLATRLQITTSPSVSFALLTTWLCLLTIVRLWRFVKKVLFLPLKLYENYMSIFEIFNIVLFATWRAFDRYQICRNCFSRWV